ncbi:MAG: 3-oxoacyl-ACP synthase [Legionella sp.]|nr:3-oxoacyl-ACP synthase [Legionella sp.]
MAYSIDNKVFITGRSALTASGASAQDTWQAVMSGQTGIAEIEQWDLSTWTHRLGGELKNFKPAQLLPDRKLIKVISRQDVIGIHVALEAVNQSQIIEHRNGLNCPDLFNNQTGIYVGSPGNKYFQQYDFLPLLAKTKANMQDFAEHLFDEVHPMWLLRILPNNVLAYTGITYGFKGPNQNITNHAAGGTQALLEAYHAVRSGQVERAVVVAYDMGIEPQALFYYEKLGLISDRHLKPFDAQHDGTILADGAAALVLESEASASARNAICYGEIIGGLAASEAKGLFSIESEGEQLTQLIHNTLNTAQLCPNDIGLVVAHGNGNKKSDDSEAHAINAVFSSSRPVVTAFKWSMGHTLCASGLVDAVLTSYALEKKCAPSIGNLQTLATTCQSLNVTTSHQTLKKNTHALMINRGFSSMNACLLMKAYD